MPRGEPFELRSVAIRAGQLLAKRLLSDSSIKMDYYNVPTTVFTPMEYEAIGNTEEDTLAKFVKDNVEDRTIGFHVIAPDAGEITEGYTIAM
ncbi:unnamed protein product [Rotaria sordida]|uniref:Pyridine nucleotide-disulphide oxidoreductase dimerisation domain-containing protein n=1 Tax=Rotaria sordida TaxID=392033 RepID=A0A818NKI8_9BILA|nr:unnamed protein product [Rotaria sordida]